MIIEILQWVLGAGGVAGFISMILYYNINKRDKTADVSKKEHDNQAAINESLREQIKFLDDRITALTMMIGERDAENAQLRREKNIQEIKYYQKKQAINMAHGCPKAKDCPVLKRLTELEKEYYEKRVQNEN